jgi:predicted transcriptional regulator of viral defense system
MKLLDRLAEKPIFRVSDATALGISPSCLCYYARINLIERIGRGVYRNNNVKKHFDPIWEDLIIIEKSVPDSVICLTTALILYDLTDEMPRNYWIAIKHETTAPKRKHTKFVRMRDMDTGKTTLKIGKESVQIFDRERTIIDAFRYLSKETALKALKAGLLGDENKKINKKKLIRYAKKFKVVVGPYILALCID